MKSYFRLRLLVNSKASVLSMPLAPFLSALFDVDDDTTFDLGFVGSLGVTSLNSKYSVKTSRLLKALIDFAWEPEAFAKDVLDELRICNNVSSFGLSL